jgi:hypothetical protein
LDFQRADLSPLQLRPLFAVAGRYSLEIYALSLLAMQVLANAGEAWATAAIALSLDVGKPRRASGWSGHLWNGGSNHAETGQL